MAGPVNAATFAPTRPLVSRPHLRRSHYRVRVGKQQISVEAYGKAKSKTLIDDLALVRQRFGLNMSEAFRVALHLTAEAIRANKSLPEVE